MDTGVKTILSTTKMSTNLSELSRLPFPIDSLHGDTSRSSCSLSWQSEYSCVSSERTYSCREVAVFLSDTPDTLRPPQMPPTREPARSANDRAGTRNQSHREGRQIVQRAFYLSPAVSKILKIYYFYIVFLYNEL